jgi:signal transduction histidine kinase
MLGLLAVALTAKLGAVGWTLWRFTRIETMPTGIELPYPGAYGPHVLRKSAINRLQEGTWSHLVRIRAEGGVRVQHVAPGSPADRAGLQTDDLIVQVNGVSLRDHPEAYFQARMRTRPGAAIPLAWLRGSMEHHGVLNIEPVPHIRYVVQVQDAVLELGVAAMTWFQRGPFLAYPFILLVIGIWIGVLRPHHAVAFHCSALFMAMGLALTSADIPMIAAWPSWALTALIVLSMTMVPLQLLMALNILTVFPHETRAGRWFRRWRGMIVLPVTAQMLIALVFLLGLTYGWQAVPMQWAEAFVRVVPESFASWVLLAVVGALLLAQRLERRHHPHMRLQMVGLGFLSALVLASLVATCQPGTLFVSWGLLPFSGPALPVAVWLMDRGLWVLLKCALPLALVYAVLARRVFGIYSSVRNILRYLLYVRLALIAAGFGLFLALYALFSAQIPETADIRFPVEVVAAGLALLAVVGWTWVNRPLGDALDRKFFPRHYAAQQTLLRIRRRLASLQPTLRILEQVGEAVYTALQVKRAACLLIGGASRSLSVAWESSTQGEDGEAHAAPIPLTPDVLKTLAEVLQAHGDTPWISLVSGRPAVWPSPSAAPFEALVPLHDRSGLAGCLALGAKMSEEPFSEEERARLMDLAAPLALALENAKLLEEIHANHERLVRLTHRLVDVQEAERKHIAYELHDEVSQALTAIQYTLHALQRDDSLDVRTLRVHLRTLMASAQQTAEQILRISRMLHPAALERAGLHAALEGLCRESMQHSHLTVHYAGVDIPSVPEDAGLALYRFVQESLTNAVKHAGAQNVWVELRRPADRIEVMVRDDGQGFGSTPGAETGDGAASGLGLEGMRERLALLGGRLDIASSPRQGTRLTATIPWRGNV